MHHGLPSLELPHSPAACGHQVRHHCQLCFLTSTASSSAPQCYRLHPFTSAARLGRLLQDRPSWGTHGHHRKSGRRLTLASTSDTWNYWSRLLAWWASQPRLGSYRWGSPGPARSCAAPYPHYSEYPALCCFHEQLWGLQAHLIHLAFSKKLTASNLASSAFATSAPRLCWGWRIFVELADLTCAWDPLGWTTFHASGQKSRGDRKGLLNQPTRQMTTRSSSDSLMRFGPLVNQDFPEFSPFATCKVYLSPDLLWLVGLPTHHFSHSTYSPTLRAQLTLW